MTTINSLASSLYDSLKDSNSSNTSKSTNPLLNELNGTGSAIKTASTQAQSSYVLDLSPEALAALERMGNAGSTSHSYAENFILTDAQKQQIEAVLAKYKDAPFTEETYQKIEAELDALGLSPDILAMKDKARNINTTSMLISALDGASGGDGLAQALGGVRNNEDTSQTKKDNYLSSLLAKWSDISTTIDTETGASES